MVVIGDSIVKNTNPKKLTKKKVHKYTFLGKSVDEIEMEVSSLNHQITPSHIIIHAGTNNLPSESAEQYVRKIENLAVSVKAN